MADNPYTPPIPLPPMLRMRQQNLNKSLHAQVDFLHSINPEIHDIILIQEPQSTFVESPGLPAATRRSIPRPTPPTTV